MFTLSKIHAREMADDPQYAAAYEALAEEFALVTELIKAQTAMRQAPVGEVDDPEMDADLRTFLS